MTAGRALTRRALLAAASATTGGLLLAGHVAADDMVVTYALDPTIGGTCLAPSCSTCNACQAHGANKLFASAAAAEAGRAHPNCLCTVVPGISVPQAVFDQLFLASASADRRTPAVFSLLQAAQSPVSAPGIGGWLPGGVLLGGLASIAWVAHRRTSVSPSAPSPR
ncbi:MAG: hypothetical protein KDB40_12735 [Acidimicrobiales bacterium]|nr:hypothetical protein [Acidimicrobiales bacterium]MCB9394377.1 hypothetical protein [Acidimicrobiaceae bacterium]